MKEKYNQLITLAKQHKVVTGIIIYLLLMVIALIVVLVVSNNRQNTDIPGVWVEETVDPASQEAILESNYQGIEKETDVPNSVTTPGFRHLYETHTDAWVSAVKTAIILHSRSNDYGLTRISLLKDSLNEYSEEDPADRNNGFRISNFVVVLNIDQITLSIKTVFDNSGLKIELFNEDGHLTTNYKANLTDRYIPVNNPVPDWLNPGPNYRTTLTDANIPEFAYGVELPPLYKNDTVQAYFACPVKNQTNTDECYIYKYDFYY